jgi:hypothetical protein
MAGDKRDSGKAGLVLRSRQGNPNPVMSLPGLTLVCFGWFGCVVSCSQMRGVWSTYLIGRTHFHDARPAANVSILLFKYLRHSDMASVLITAFEIFTRVSPNNSLERLTERSVGIVTDRPSDVYELFVTLL